MSVKVLGHQPMIGQSEIRNLLRQMYGSCVTCTIYYPI